MLVNGASTGSASVAIGCPPPSFEREGSAGDLLRTLFGLAFGAALRGFGFIKLDEAFKTFLAFWVGAFVFIKRHSVSSGGAAPYPLGNVPLTAEEDFRARCGHYFNEQDCGPVRGET